MPHGGNGEGATKTLTTPLHVLERGRYCLRIVLLLKATEGSVTLSWIRARMPTTSPNVILRTLEILADAGFVLRENKEGGRRGGVYRLGEAGARLAGLPPGEWDVLTVRNR